jgi:hypothetical protein
MIGTAPRRRTSGSALLLPTAAPARTRSRPTVLGTSSAASSSRPVPYLRLHGPDVMVAHSPAGGLVRGWPAKWAVTVATSAMDTARPTTFFRRTRMSRSMVTSGRTTASVPPPGIRLNGRWASSGWPQERRPAAETLRPRRWTARTWDVALSPACLDRRKRERCAFLCRMSTHQNRSLAYPKKKDLK